MKTQIRGEPGFAAAVLLKSRSPRENRSKTQPMKRLLALGIT